MPCVPPPWIRRLSFLPALGPEPALATTSFCPAPTTTFFSESVMPTRSCVFSLAAEMTKLLPVHHDLGDAHRVRLEVFSSMH